MQYIAGMVEIFLSCFWPNVDGPSFYSSATRIQPGLVAALNTRLFSHAQHSGPETKMIEWAIWSQTH